MAKEVTRPSAKQQEVAEVEDENYLPAEMMEELVADAGAGLSQSADDNIVPFIILLQDMSPEVKKRDPNYVEGAEAGMYLNRATKQLWAGDAEMAERTGFPQLEFQHCYFDRQVVEWIPRQDGGGFVARHALQGTVDDTMKAIGGKQVSDPQDPNKMNWKTSDGSHDLIDTRYHFGNVVNGGSAKPAVLAFSSTGHTASRSWMTTMNEFKVIDPKTGQPMRNEKGEPLRLPAWARKYRIGTKPRENKKGSFFVATVEDGGLIRDGYIRAQGKALYDGAKAGLITASQDEANHGQSVSDEI
jgi:hypothetical protein